MADETTYVLRLAAWLGRALGDTEPFFADFSTEELGLELPDAVVQALAVATALSQAQVAANDVENAGTELETAAGSGDELTILAKIIVLGTELGKFYTALDNLSGAVRNSVTAANVPDAAARAAAESFADALAKRLSDFAIGSAIADQTPELAYLLSLVGLFDWRYLPPEAGNDLSRDYVRKTLQLDRFKNLITDPDQHFKDAIGWGNPNFDPTHFFRTTADFFDEEDDVEVGIESGEPFLRVGSFLIRRDGSVSPPGFLLTLIGELDANFEERTEFDAWGVSIKSRFRATGSLSGRITPPLTVKLQPLAGQITGDLQVYVDRNEDARPVDVLGGTGGLLSMTFDNISAGLGLQAGWNAATGEATIDPVVFANIDRAIVKIGTSDGDSFIDKLLGDTKIEGNFDLGLEWRASEGLTVRGSGGIEIALPVHKQLGPIEFQTVYLALQIKSDGTLSLEVSTALAGKLGPLSLAIDRMGALLDIGFAEEADADYGAFDLELGFKPPTGIGLDIAGGGFKGGGFLSFDPDNERYVGFLELELKETVDLKAIGLLTTRLPGGEPGFSLLIIITAEFSPIQLGFGFTLNGVGGLLGLNRTMRIERLRTGIRDNTLSSILFPADPVANVNRIISDLRQVFPPQTRRFVFGPMGKIGWGTPTLITIDVGLALEIPDPVTLAILGVLKALLPDEETKLLRLQVNFLGVIDFEKEQLSFDATIYDSKLLSFPLSGDMALRLSWGNNPNFLLTVGGFHPAYDPPPLALPALRRITVQLLQGKNPRLTLETYFAVTSNTVQFGAKLELYAGAGPFNVYGLLAFDALFQFSPFYFIAAISAMLALRRGSNSIAAIKLALTLEGTTPWKAKGTATLKLCWFIKVKVRFNKTFGQSRDTRLDDIEVLPLLTAALQAPGNWEARPPARRHLLVSLKEIDTTGKVIVAHPFGVLTVSQKVVPLNVRIDTFGHQQPRDGHEFRITGVTVEGKAQTPDAAKEYFAPAQFFEKSDAEKLSSKSFERYDSGIRLTETEELESDHVVSREVEYELSYIDSQRSLPRPPTLIAPDLVAFNAWASRGAIAQSPLSHVRTGKSALAPDAVRVAQEDYAVVTVSDLTPAAADPVRGSEAEALAYMQELIAQEPALGGKLQVVPSFELN